MIVPAQAQENQNQDVQTIRITGIEVLENATQLQLESTGQFEWTQCQFMTQKVFPNPFFPEGEGTRHHLSFGQPESQTFEWAQTDFIIVGEFEIIDPNTIELYMSFSRDEKMTAVWDAGSKTMELDGLKYDAFVNPSRFVLATSNDLKEWTPKPLTGLTPTLIPLGESFSMTQPTAGGAEFFTIGIRP